MYICIYLYVCSVCAFRDSNSILNENIKIYTRQLHGIFLFFFLFFFIYTTTSVTVCLAISKKNATVAVIDIATTRCGCICRAGMYVCLLRVYLYVCVYVCVQNKRRTGGKKITVKQLVEGAR